MGTSVKPSLDRMADSCPPGPDAVAGMSAARDGLSPDVTGGPARHVCTGRERAISPRNRKA